MRSAVSVLHGSGRLAHTAVDFREVHDGLRNVVEVVGEDVEADVRDGLHDFRIGDVGCASSPELGITQNPAL